MDQILALINGLSLKQRISILAAAVAVVAGVLAFVHFKHEGEFRPLYTSMAPEDAASVVQKLKETGVEYRLADGGASVVVPADKLAESRLALAAAGLPKTGRIGFELFDKNNFGATEFVEHINYKRALEGELERSVMSLAEVEQARVHLTLPKESVFLDQQQPAKASVMVKLRPGAEISPQNIAAVTNLVASAVEGLTPESVSLVDMDGTLLNRPKKVSVEGAEMSGEMLETRQQIEKTLVNKISETLEPILGPKGFRAGASVDYDLSSAEQQEETLDPSKSVMLSSQKTEDLSEKGTSAGVPGTQSNLPQQASTLTKGSNGTSRRTENVTYQTSRVIKHTKTPQGIIKRMSLAVLVDQTVRWEGDGNAKHKVLVPPSPETLKSIKDLVAGVTGLDTQRGDQLIVETLPFESSLNAEPPKAPKAAPPTVKNPAWLEFVNKYRALWAPASLGVLLLLFLGKGIFKSRRRAPAAEAEVPTGLEGPAVHTQLSPAAQEIAAGALAAPDDSHELAERVRMVAKREPDMAINVLRMWLQETKAGSHHEVRT